MRMKGLLRSGSRMNAYAMLHTALVLNGTVNEREEGIVLAAAHILTGVDVRATLADENRARSDGLATEALAAKTLTAGIAAITGGTESFLCAMSYLLSRSRELLGGGSLGRSLGILGGLTGSARGSLDLGDLDLGELLAMALETMIALALLELEDKLLLALELIDDLGRDLGLGKLSGIGDDLLAVVQEEDGELDLGADLGVDLLDGDDIVLSDLVLLAAC